MKRINPLTGHLFKQGDTREDGLVFWSYVNTQTKADGMVREQWYAPAVFHRLRIKNILRLGKARAQREGLPFNVTLEHLLSIYPKNNTCPVLGVEMIWGSEDRSTSPSLDKIIPSLGYLIGNVCWISQKANQLKNDATLEQLEALVSYVRFHKENHFREAA